jgi:hypothetical protein
MSGAASISASVGITDGGSGAKYGTSNEAAIFVYHRVFMCGRRLGMMKDFQG